MPSPQTTDREKPVLVIFRNDLRIADNLALSAAVDSARPVALAFILDEESPNVRRLGGARRWWLHHALASLSESIKGLGGKLILRRGRMDRTVDELVTESGADTVFWNRRYAPSEDAIDEKMKAGLTKRGIIAEGFEGQLLHEPSRLKTKTGGPYKVYTPFWKALSALPEPRDPIDAPKEIHGFNGKLESSSLQQLDLLPQPDWAGGLRERWQPGEAGAHQRLDDFLADDLDGYGMGRDVPGVDGTSRLSPHLANGEITPFQVLAALKRRSTKAPNGDVEKFRKELAWREFCYHLLFHNPDLHRANFHAGFDAFPWKGDARSRDAWRRGRTGYPIVDAGMRELWATGFMQNRVRMIAASLLIKHLLTDWRDGEAWFWDTLVDADPANNPANWQWVAGSGADAAPFFRIFNPVLQGQKFDADGSYVRHYVPELAKLPDTHLHRPWEASKSMLDAAGVKLGVTYPVPVVEHAEARKRALAAYRSTRKN